MIIIEHTVIIISTDFMVVEKMLYYFGKLLKVVSGSSVFVLHGI